jgi:hypothetical protein
MTGSQHRIPANPGAFRLYGAFMGKPLFPHRNLARPLSHQGHGGFRPLRDQPGETAMTALVFENLTTLPAQAQSLRMQLVRWARTLNKLVSARAARQVPEWRMREVRNDVIRCRSLVGSNRSLSGLAK